MWYNVHVANSSYMKNLKKKKEKKTMSKEINSFNVSGRLGQDVELKTGGGTSYVNMSIPMSEKAKDGTEVTEWLNVTAFGKLAEFAAQYLHKGSRIHVGGKLQLGRYEKDGVMIKTAKVIANEITMLDSKKDSEGASVAPVASKPATKASNAPKSGKAASPFEDDDMDFLNS